MFKPHHNNIFIFIRHILSVLNYMNWKWFTVTLKYRCNKSTHLIYHYDIHDQKGD